MILGEQPSAHARQSVTLYEDWQQRRSAAQAKADPQTAKLLDYLLSRYQDDSLAQSPAMFPLPSRVTLNAKAMVVNYHLAKRAGLGATGNAQEASARVTNLLREMAARPTTDDTLDDPFGYDTSEFMTSAEFRKLKSAWRRLNKLVSHGSIEEIVEAQSEEFGGLWSSSTIGAATNTLTCFPHRKAVSYCLLFWRRLLASFGRSWLTDRLEARFTQPDCRELAASRMRDALGMMRSSFVAGHWSCSDCTSAIRKISGCCWTFTTCLREQSTIVCDRISSSP